MALSLRGSRTVIPRSRLLLSRGLCLAFTILALLLAWQGPAQADRVGTIKVPEVFPDLINPPQFPPLLDPQPLNGSWAEPDHHPLGVHLDNYSLTREQIDAAQSTGCKLVRLAIPMESFISGAEPDWGVLDQVISRLSRAGFEVLPVLTAKAAVPEFYVPFCQAVAKRYGTTFSCYQLLDNINYSIGLQTQDYANLIARSRSVIIGADPGALIICGGIRGADMTYLGMLENQGALNSLDVLAFNLFPPAGGIEGTSVTSRPEHCLPYMQEALDWAWARGKRVWVTSLGVSTSYNWVGVDQASQASMYARGALYLGYMGVERIIFSAIQDTDESYVRPVQCCGLLDAWGMPKASYYALRALNTAIDGAYHVAPPFMYQGVVYERPSANDLIVAQELIGTPGADALSEFQVHGLEVYAFWFYAPASQQYRLVYWLSRDNSRTMLITLHLGHIGLTPLDSFILLDNAPSPVAYQFAKNFLYVPYVPLSAIPGVIRFEVNEHERTP